MAAAYSQVLAAAGVELRGPGDSLRGCDVLSAALTAGQPWRDCRP